MLIREVLIWLVISITLVTFLGILTSMINPAIRFPLLFIALLLFTIALIARIVHLIVEFKNKI